MSDRRIHASSNPLPIAMPPSSSSSMNSATGTSSRDSPPALPPSTSTSTAASLTSAVELLTAGGVFIKYAMGRGSPGERFVALVSSSSSDAPTSGTPSPNDSNASIVSSRSGIMWTDHRKRNQRSNSTASASPPTPATAANAAAAIQSSTPAHSRDQSQSTAASDRMLLLGEITDLYGGRLTKAFLKNDSTDTSTCDGACCLSIRAGDRTLDLQMPSQQLRDAWLAAIARVLKSIGKHVRLHVCIDTHTDPTNAAALKAQGALTLTADPTNASGKVGASVTPQQMDSNIGTIQYLEEIIREKESQISALKAANGSTSVSAVGIEKLGLHDRVHDLGEQLTRSQARLEQETISRTEAQMSLANALNQLAAHERNTQQAVEKAKSDSEGTSTGKYEQMLEQERAKCAALEAELKSHQQTNAQQALELDELRQKATLLGSSIPAGLEEDRSRLQQELTIVKKSLLAERETNRTLEDDLRDVEQALQTAEKERQSLASQVQALEEEISHLDGDLNEKDKQINQLKEEKSAAEAEARTGAMIAAAKKETTESAVSSSPITQAVTASPSSPIPPSSPTTAGGATLEETPAASAAASGVSIVDLQHQLMEKEDEIKELKFQLSSKESKEKKAASAASKSAEKKLQDKVKELQGQLQASETKLTELHQLQSKHAAQIESIESLHAQSLKSLEAKMENSEKALFEDLSKSTQMKLEALRLENGEQVQQLEKQLADVQKELDSKEEHIKQLQSELGEAKTKQSADAEAGEMNAASAAEVSHLKELTEQQVTEIKQLQEQIKRLKESVAAAAAAETATATAPVAVPAAESPSTTTTTGATRNYEKELTSLRTILSTQIAQHLEDEANIDHLNARVTEQEALLKETKHQLELLESARSDLAAKNLSLQSELARASTFAQQLEAASTRDAAKLEEALLAVKTLEHEADERVKFELHAGEKEREAVAARDQMSLILQQQIQAVEQAEHTIIKLQAELQSAKAAEIVATTTLSEIQSSNQSSTQAAQAAAEAIASEKAATAATADKLRESEQSLAAQLATIRELQSEVARLSHELQSATAVETGASTENNIESKGDQIDVAPHDANLSTPPRTSPEPTDNAEDAESLSASQRANNTRRRPSASRLPSLTPNNESVATSAPSTPANGNGPARASGLKPPSFRSPSTQLTGTPATGGSSTQGDVTAESGELSAQSAADALQLASMKSRKLKPPTPTHK